MNQVALLAGLRATLARRWVSENAFTLVVMGPLVLGGAMLIFAPYLEAAGRAARSGAWIAEHAGALAGAVAVALLVARLSSAVRDAFAVDGDESYLDALPFSPIARAHDVLAVRVAKALPLAGAGVVLAVLARAAGATVVSTAAAWAPGLVAGAVWLAVVETGAAFALVRLRLVTGPRLAAVGAVAAAAAFAAGPAAVAVAAVTLALGYAGALVGFVRWRVRDRDAAREALARARRTGAGLERLADHALGTSVGAQVVRDLRLVRRGFSTVPYVALAVAALLPALAVWASGRYGLEPVWRARAIESATVLAAFALAAVTHALVVYERTRVWIDLTSGVAPEDFPRAKTWLGRALALPAFALGCAAALTAGVPLGPRELLQLAWLTWSAATLTSILCYELKERPAAGVVLAFLPGAGIPLLTAIYGPGEIMWYLALFGYVYATANLGPRAATKVEWER